MTGLPDVSRHLPTDGGFCRPDWTEITRVIEGKLPEAEWGEAWDEVSRQWLDRLCDEAGNGYHVNESKNFLLLSCASKWERRSAEKFFEGALTQIQKTLPGVAVDEGYGKHVVLMFADVEAYYRYIAYYYPDGEHSQSSGVCLEGNGYIHFALPAFDFSNYRTVVVHELTHGCLAHLPLPAWINEALAMRMEQVVCGTATFEIDREIYQRHVDYWNRDTIQQFWSGEAWTIPGPGFELSYNLAQVLWRKLEVDLRTPTDVLVRFVGAVDWADAGESACQETFRLGLGDVVEDFLGEGPWAPNPASWEFRLGDEAGHDFDG